MSAMELRYSIIFVVLAGLLIYLAVRMGRSRQPTAPLSDWFSVSFDEYRVTMTAAPPSKKPWEQSFLWSEIQRICFKSEGISSSDGIYVFTTQRPESFVVPIEASGGAEFWSKLIERELFPAALAIEAAGLPEGETLWWPRIEH